MLNLEAQGLNPALQLLIVSRGVHIIRTGHEIFDPGLLLLATLRIAHGEGKRTRAKQFLDLLPDDVQGGLFVRDEQHLLAQQHRRKEHSGDGVRLAGPGRPLDIADLRGPGIGNGLLLRLGERKRNQRDEAFVNGAT